MNINLLVKHLAKLNELTDNISLLAVSDNPHVVAYINIIAAKENIYQRVSRAFAKCLSPG